MYGKTFWSSTPRICWLLSLLMIPTSTWEPNSRWGTLWPECCPTGNHRYLCTGTQVSMQYKGILLESFVLTYYIHYITHGLHVSVYLGVRLTSFEFRWSLYTGCCTFTMGLNRVPKYFRRAPSASGPLDLIWEKVWTVVRGKRQIIFRTRLNWSTSLKYDVFLI